MFKEKETKKGILRSLIASSIFLIFLKPILEFIWGMLVKISGVSFSYFLDRMYMGAALGQRNWIDFILITGIIMVGGFSLLITKHIIKKRFKYLGLQHKLKTEEDEEKRSFLNQQLNKLKSTAAFRSKVSLFLFRNNLLLDIPFAFCCLYMIFSTYTDLQLNTSFNQRLNAISPYVTDYEYKHFKSQWALMRSRNDYEILNSQIENVGNKNKLTLPENLLP